MRVEAIAGEIFRVIGEEFKVPLDTLSLATSFKKDLQADSLSLIELSLVMEERFGLRVEDEQFRDFQTIGDVVTFIEAHADKAALPEGEASV